MVFGPNGVGQLEVDDLTDQVAIDRFNRIWAVTRGNRLLLVEEDVTRGGIKLRKIASWEATPGAGPRSVVTDKEGRVWVGTRDHGLYCLYFDGLKIRAYRQLTMKNGLSENFVRCLYCDPDNTIWAGTASGLDRIRWQKDSLTVANIAPGHEMSVDKISGSADDVHWAISSGGYLQIVHSAARPTGYLPQVLFSQVLVGNEAVPDVPGRTLSLSYDQNALSFYVSAPTFIDEGKARFSYLLEGSSDARWSVPSNQTAINFVNLPPGRYILRVKAHFLSGIYPDETGAYGFQIRPPWWQTLAFRASMALLLAAGIGWAIRSYTVRRLKAQRVVLERQKAIEKERTRIATDMHDDLGAGLSRIKFLSDTIGIKQQRQQPIDEEISGIREYSREMIDKMGEIVWALNQKNDLLSDLLSYTRSYAAAYLMQAGIRSLIDAPEEFPNRFVSGEFRRNVYLAVKEALHNIVKHSEAQVVSMKMVVNKELVIVLQDDGIGFDRSAIRPFANGLNNMELRIGELGGVLRIESRDAGAGVPGAWSGTTLTIAVPI
jgi:signal transduction histidine kinase